MLDKWSKAQYLWFWDFHLLPIECFLEEFTAFFSEEQNGQEQLSFHNSLASNPASHHSNRLCDIVYNQKGRVA
jgi:hypothetical protein